MYVYMYVRTEREREIERASETRASSIPPQQNLGSPDRTPASACGNAPDK